MKVAMWGLVAFSGVMAIIGTAVGDQEAAREYLTHAMLWWLLAEKT